MDEGKKKRKKLQAARNRSFFGENNCPTCIFSFEEDNKSSLFSRLELEAALVNYFNYGFVTIQLRDQVHQLAQLSWNFFLFFSLFSSLLETNLKGSRCTMEQREQLEGGYVMLLAKNREWRINSSCLLNIFEEYTYTYFSSHLIPFPSYPITRLNDTSNILLRMTTARTKNRSKVSVRQIGA